MGLLDWVIGGGSGVLSSRESSFISGTRNSLLLHDGQLQSQHSEVSECIHSEEQRYVQRRIRDNPMWTLDRGTGFYAEERVHKKKASLLGTGKDAGKSKVVYHGIEWSRIMRHIWKRDFFTTAVHSRFPVLVAAMVCVYITSFAAWACLYYVIWRFLDETCFLGFNSFLSAFLFSIETQNTIGYGSHAIGDCWLPAWLVGIQCILAVLLEAIFLGIIFAKISHPKGRSRTILISECACIARRDGILKFMFRVADIRKRTAIAPKIHAVMYTWGPGHTTAEGEHIPVMVQPLPLHYLDATLLLPVVVEHTIDERSPLYGHTAASLEALSAEVVVTFEAQSELGDSFMTRQSYLPTEIHWGCMFVNIIRQAGRGTTQHSIDLARFHEVEPMDMLTLMPPSRVSRAVVLGGARRVPCPRLGENTMLLSDELVVTQGASGRWFVAVRVGDVYPSQMCSVTVKMFIYRYSSALSASSSSAADGLAASHLQQTYSHQELPLTRHLFGSIHNPAVTAAATAAVVAGASPQQQQQQHHSGGGSGSTLATDAGHAPTQQFGDAGGGVNVLLRYPVVVGHEIGPTSPLQEWVTPDGMLKDADAEIVVVASATMYVTSHLSMRSKVYSVLGSIRWGHSFEQCVIPPKRSPTGHAQVDWSSFHSVVATHPGARSKRHGQQQQQQQQQQLSPTSSINTGTWQQQQQQPPAAPDAFSSQVVAAHEQFNGCHPQQQQPHLLHGRSQLNRVTSSRTSSRDLGNSSSLSAVVVHNQGGPVSHQLQQGGHQQLQTEQSHLSDGSSLSTAFGSLQMMHGGAAVSDHLQIALAHSLGLQELQQISMTSTQQRPGDDLSPRALLLQEQQQQQGGWRGLSSSSSHLSYAAGAGSNNAFDRVTAAAAAAGWDWEEDEEDDADHEASFTRSGVTGFSSRARTAQGMAQHQQQQLQLDQEQLYEETHILTMLPGRGNSWSGKRSLAGIMDLFEQPADTTSAAAPLPAGIVEEEEAPTMTADVDSR